MSEYPRPANKWDFCFSHGAQIPLGEMTHWRDERTVCMRCSVLYDRRKPIESGSVSSRAKRVRKPKKVEAVEMILKLKEVGEEATFKVAGCDVAKGEYGEQVMFKAWDNDDILYIPRPSADRQLSRLGYAGVVDGEVDYREVEGATLRFYRAPSSKPGAKPFWNIDRVPETKNGAVKPTATPEKPRVTASVPDKDLPPELRNTAVEETAALHEKIGFDRSKIETTLSLYQSIAEWGARELPKIFEGGKNPVGITPETLAACINTIFINTSGKK